MAAILRLEATVWLGPEISESWEVSQAPGFRSLVMDCRPDQRQIKGRVKNIGKAQWWQPFAASGWHLSITKLPLPSDGLSTGGEERGPAQPTETTTQGPWEPLGLTSDFAGDETMPKQLTPRYCHPCRPGTVSPFIPPPHPHSRKPGLEWGGNGNVGVNTAQAIDGWEQK